MSSILFSSRLRTDENPSQGKKLPIEQENFGKQHGLLPSKTPRKALGSLKNNSTQPQSARKPLLLSSGAQDGGNKSARKHPEPKTRVESHSSTKKPSARPSHHQESDFSEDMEYMPEPAQEKKDPYHPPSFVQALRTFRPPLHHRDCGSAVKDVLFEEMSLQPDPSRPRRPDEDRLTFVDVQATSEPDIELPDISDLDMLLADLS